MASPDWQQIFTRRPDLNPPGHDEVINDMKNNPWRKPERCSKRNSRNKKTAK